MFLQKFLIDGKVYEVTAQTNQRMEGLIELGLSRGATGGRMTIYRKVLRLHPVRIDCVNLAELEKYRSARQPA